MYENIVTSSFCLFWIMAELSWQFSNTQIDKRSVVPWSVSSMNHITGNYIRKKITSIRLNILEEGNSPGGDEIKEKT